MRDTRASLLLLVSLLLFLMSFVILCTWGYNAYYKTGNEKVKTIVLTGDSALLKKATINITNGTRDSLQKIYAATIARLDSHFDTSLHYAASLLAPLDSKLNEFFKLRTEIVNILKENKKGDMDVALKKIVELQKKVNDLIDINNEVAQDNKRLNAILQQLSNDATKSVEHPLSTSEVINLPAKINNKENLFVAYDLRLSAVTVTDNKELETIQALQTDKFVGSFIVKNNNSLNNVAEMIVVVLQPDGNVLQKSTWESGTFETPEGRKIYSCKMRFDYTKGEPKRLLFSLSTEKYIKGNYTMQVYYNGALIGKINKALS